MKSAKLLPVFILPMIFVILNGCATYTTPAGGVDIPAITDENIEDTVKAVIAL